MDWADTHRRLMGVWGHPGLDHEGCRKPGVPVLRGREIRGCILAAVFFLAGTFLAWKLELKIPADLIPSRWSDFEFWARRIEELRLDMAATGEAGAVRWLAQLKGRLAVCLICSLAGGAGGIMWRRT